VRTVTVYGKPGCCLCETAVAVLQRLRAVHPFALEEVDITRDDAVHKRFLVRIPVIALDGEELYDYEIDEQDLAERLARPSASGGRG